MGLRQTGIVCRRDAEGDQRARERTRGRARGERAAARRRRFSVRRPLCRRQSARGLGRGGRERRASSTATWRSSATSSILRRRSRRISRRSTSIRPGPCRSRSSRKRSSRGCSATRLPRARENPHPRRCGRRGRSQDASTGRPNARPITCCARTRRRQFARRDPHRHAQQARRLHARHAVETPVRRRLSLLEPRLRAGAGRLRLRRLAARRDERRPGRRLGQGCAARRRSRTARARTSS